MRCVAMTARIIAAIERALSIACRIDGHTPDHDGLCMRCTARVFPDPRWHAAPVTTYQEIR